GLEQDDVGAAFGEDLGRHAAAGSGAHDTDVVFLRPAQVLHGRSPSSVVDAWSADTLVPWGAERQFSYRASWVSAYPADKREEHRIDRQAVLRSGLARQ